MNIAELEAFIAVANLGNYSRAAQQLDISQPAISRRISLLEGDLGTKLFERGRHGARLTPAGETYLLFARRALGELTAGHRAVQASLAGDRGTIRLAISGTIPNTAIMDVLRRFRDDHPKVHLSIVTAKSDEVGELVAHGEADAGLRYFADADPHLKSMEIMRERGGIYCASNTSLLDTTNITLDALSRCPWIMFPTGVGSSGEPFAIESIHLLAGAGIFPEEIVRIDGLSAQKRLVTSDFGITLMQASALADELTAGTVKQIVPELINVRFPIHLVVRVNRHTNPLTDRLVVALQELADKPI